MGEAIRWALNSLGLGVVEYLEALKADGMPARED